MYSLNKVILIGNLVREPEVRFTNEGVPVTTFSIAINQYGRDKENQEPTFIKIVTWRKLAENCGQYLHKGSTILAEGRLRSRRFTSKDGIKVTTIEVIAQNIQFLRLKEKEEVAPVGEVTPVEKEESEPKKSFETGISSPEESSSETHDDMLPDETDSDISSSDKDIPF